MALSIANLRGMVDNISKNVKLLITTLGSSTTADTILYHIAQNQTRIDSIADKDYEKYLELANDKARTEAAGIPYIVYAILARQLAEAVRENEGKDFDDSWEEKSESESAANKRIPCYFADLSKSQIDPSLIFPPENIKLGDYDIGTSTYTDDQEIDTERYGGAVLKCKVTTQIDAANDAAVTLTGKDENGSAWEGSCTIPMGSTVGTEVEVTPKIAGTYCADLQNVTVTGATTGAFDVKSKEDRTLAA